MHLVKQTKFNRMLMHLVNDDKTFEILKNFKLKVEK